MRWLVAELDSIEALIDETEAKKQVHETADLLRYSDLAGTPQVADLEERIENNIGLLREEAEEEKVEEILARAKKLKNLINERSAKVKATKR